MVVVKKFVGKEESMDERGILNNDDFGPINFLGGEVCEVVCDDFGMPEGKIHVDPGALEVDLADLGEVDRGADWPEKY